MSFCPDKTSCWRIVCASCLLSATTAAAQPLAERGRLPDGRAYRIENGMRLADYVAELEVTVDDLHRQLNALQDEVGDKQRRLEARGDGACPKPVKETNLVGSSAEHPGSECATTVTTLNARVVSLEQQLKQSGQRLGPACDYNSPANPLWDQVAKLQNAAKDAEAREQHARAGQTPRDEQISGLKRELDTQASKGTALEGELARVKSELDETKGALEEQRTLAAAHEAESARLAESRAALAPPAPARLDRKAPVQAAAETPALTTAERSGAAADMRTKLAAIQSLISERKNLYDSITAKRHGVSISLQPLVTKSGVSLDSLRSSVKTLDGETDLAALRANIFEIEGILKDDIGVMKRLGRI